MNLKHTCIALSLFWFIVTSHAVFAATQDLVSFPSKPLAALYQTDLSHTFGRVLRGKTAQDFDKLSDDPSRKIVMLMGPDGLKRLLDKTGYEIMLTLGYEPSYLAYKIEQGTLFKLITFKPNAPPLLATWDNVLELVSQVYPAIKDDLLKNKEALKQNSFKEIERMAKFCFGEIEKKGPNHPNFMTYEKYLKSDRTLVDTRGFLYFTLYLREQYSGDGYTYDDHGQRGIVEYVYLNKSLNEIGPYLLFNLPVQPIHVQ